MRCSVLSLLFGVLATAGQASDLVGTWNCSGATKDNGVTRQLFERANYKSKGTVVSDLRFVEIEDGMQFEVNAKTHASWSLVGDSLDIKPFRARIFSLALDGKRIGNLSLQSEIRELLLKDSAPLRVEEKTSDRILLVAEHVTATCLRIQ